jgi:hypothetical protein
VTDLDDAAWRNLDRETQLTTNPAEIDPALAELLADTIAPLTPSAADIVAQRVINPRSEDKHRPLAFPFVES